MSQIMSKFVEMENTKINPLNWEDDMLGVEPLELQFEYNEQQQILSCAVVLSNDTDGPIAFNIQSTSLLPYSIESNKDIVKPHSKCSVVIALPVTSAQDHKAALPYSANNKQYSKDFIVRSIKVNEGLTTKDINKDMFDIHEEGHHIDEIYLIVVCEEPCNNEFIKFQREQKQKQKECGSSSSVTVSPPPLDACSAAQPTAMSRTYVIRVDITAKRDKVLHIIENTHGFKSIEAKWDEGMLTVVGHMDVISLLSRLKNRQFRPQLISVGESEA
ncbi:uncharacterized protein LOC119366113 isoform X2 [Triticum dicoccoides]|uniref:uncharacterized protein LOC119366113 isoform X2 n=1 Tax=Triticum dicoccoides TaxID=85692 RepID=UPI0018900A53|nr:uncharacterized protein LOC119366113 isoform X2 [Triticum dicoccoides]